MNYEGNSIRGQYCDLICDIHAHNTLDNLTVSLSLANKLFKMAENLMDAMLDSRYLLQVTTAVARHLRELDLGRGDFNRDLFVEWLQGFIGGDTEKKAIDWEKLGRLALGKTRCMPVMHM
ncbi:hypothetical protein K438DRAFT_1993446 [Mycena galopus ATCC 62051]|nr:hypothetical protein K438DRAFT_1993446 [Mycena galopus ATCC 62051]